MDGMAVTYHPVNTGGRGSAVVTNTIRLPAPTAVIAEISLASFDTYGTDSSAFAVFTGCMTNGSNPPKPPSEIFSYFGSLSGPPRSVVIRNGLTSISYEIDVANCNAEFVINLSFWPSVSTGNL